MKKLNSKNYFLKIGFAIMFTLNMISVVRVDTQYEFFVPKTPPNSHYLINAKINVNKGIIEGEQIITFVNSSNKEIKILAFDWTISESRKIKVSLNDESLSLLNLKENNRASPPLLYSLKTPIKIDEKVQIKVIFSTIGIGNKEKMISSIWNPRLWWDGINTFDFYEVKFDIPEGYALAISGRLNERTGYYENDGVRTCGIYLDKGLKTEQKEVEGILIKALFTEKGSECAQLCLNTAVDAVKFYKNWLGFYPFKFLYIIPGGSRPVGGYPLASGIVVIHGQEQFNKMPLLHWKWITAHEIGHQYWGEYVMGSDNNDWLSWLMIGLGIYADREYTLFRNIGLEKHIGIVNRYLDGVREHYDTTVDINTEQLKKIKYDRNNIVDHGKSFSIISALECVLGKETFEKIYKKCLNEYRGRRLGYKEFWKICEEESGENLTWFFDQWVRSNKYLCYQIIPQESIAEDKKYISNIEVECTGTLQMPVPVNAVFEDGSSQIKYTNRLFRINNLKFESNSKLKKVILDPENKLAMLKTPLSILPEELPEFINQLPWTGAGKGALEAFKKAVSVKLDIFDLWFKLGLTLFDGGYYKKSFDAFKKVTELESGKIYKFSSFVWLGHLMDLQGKRNEALSYYNEALKYDEGGSMQHSQFNMFINRKWVEERLKTPFKWK